MQKFDSLENSAFINNSTYSYFFNQLYSIAMSMFEWKGLPDNIDARFLEMNLFWRGESIFFKDNVGDFFATLPTLSMGPLNIYGIPTIRTAYSFNGYNYSGLTDKDSVLIYDNYARIPIAPTIQLLSQRLYDIQRTIDINIKSQKTPILIKVDDNSTLLSLKNIYMKYDGNIPVIFTSKGFDVNALSVLKTDAPFIADKVYLLKKQIWNEGLTFLGVECNTNEKVERQYTSEIQSNLGVTESQRLIRLKARKQASDSINKMFGLNTSVDFSSSLSLSKIMEDSLDSGEFKINE